jgi:hypothetical protein
MPLLRERRWGVGLRARTVTAGLKDWRMGALLLVWRKTGSGFSLLQVYVLGLGELVGGGGGMGGVDVRGLPQLAVELGVLRAALGFGDLDGLGGLCGLCVFFLCGGLVCATVACVGWDYTSASDSQSSSHASASAPFLVDIAAFRQYADYFLGFYGVAKGLNV